MTEPPEQRPVAAAAGSTASPVPREGSEGSAAKVRSAPPHQASDDSPLRLLMGRDLIALGFLLVLASLALAVAFFDTATDVATAIGPVTTLVGSLLGAVFGIQVGSQGREKESEGKAKAAQRTAEAAALLPTPAGRALVKMWKTEDSGSGNPTLEDF